VTLGILSPKPVIRRTLLESYSGATNVVALWILELASNISRHAAVRRSASLRYRCGCLSGAPFVPSWAAFLAESRWTSDESTITSILAAIIRGAYAMAPNVQAGDRRRAFSVHADDLMATLGQVSYLPEFSPRTTGCEGRDSASLVGRISAMLVPYASCGHIRVWGSLILEGSAACSSLQAFASPFSGINTTRRTLEELAPAH